MLDTLNYKKKNFDLPIENLKDLLNILRQDIKFKYIPFKLYYKYRSYKYANKITPELNLIKNLTDISKTSLDIGANLGLFTFFIQKYSKFVYAFEPNPYPLRYLYDLVGENVKVFPIAISELNSEVILNIPKKPKGWSSNGASLKYKNEFAIKYKVDSRTVDSLKIENLGFIKIDVEGNEMGVLQGAKKTLIEQRPNLIVENESIHQKDPNKIFKFLSDYDYFAFYTLKKGKIIKIEKNIEIEKLQKNPELKRYGYVQNFIFIHKSKINKFYKIID